MPLCLPDEQHTGLPRGLRVGGCNDLPKAAAHAQQAAELRAAGEDGKERQTAMAIVRRVQSPLNLYR
jgi:hypothetical protein